MVGCSETASATCSCDSKAGVPGLQLVEESKTRDASIPMSIATCVFYYEYAVRPFLVPQRAYLLIPFV